MNSVLVRMLDGFAAGVRKMNDAAIYVGILTICVITVVSLYTVAARLIGSPVSWTLEFLQLIQVILAFLPVAYVLNRGAHVRMDLGLEMVQGRSRYLLQIAASLLGMFMSILMAYATAQSAIASTAMREGSVLTSWPIYPFKICVFIGFVLLSLQFAGHAWEHIRSILFPGTGAERAGSHVYL